LPIAALLSSGSESITLAAPCLFKIEQAAIPIGPPPQMTTLSPGLIPPALSITAL